MGAMTTLRASDAPDPEGDRRFAEAPFPLLQPVGWRGERSRGGYATSGSRTIALGLVFGPLDGVDGTPRLEISVGSEFFEDLPDECAPATAAAIVGLEPDDEFSYEQATASTEAIQVEGEPIEFTIVSLGPLWVGRGRWNEHVVEIHAEHTEPRGVTLERVGLERAPVAQEPPIEDDAASKAVRLNLLVLRCADPDQTRRFYECLGVAFVNHQHGDGPVHYAHEGNPSIIELYPAGPDGPDTAGVGFEVEHIQAAWARLKEAGFAPGDIAQRPWGMSFVVRDADNRRVEIQASA